jgi:hydroxymethylpyrimidine pyrophosphatase-like HAD family hydrolase
LIERTGFTKERLAGVGDSLSDLAIAERVAYFAVPKNADERLKPHAQYVSPLEEIDGVLEILERVG